ncbi:unnamed protein product [Parnassius apollo]|uniref:(apollo) hypothetical protein n=1 Tax=Parnassius apollo TaxID=110799 RepID=A0A8S3XD86_PARAO|nr:unnamed protein product [Parnassius apollo]
MTKDDYPGTRYAATKNGWMETDVFERFFEKVFLPTVGQKRPILLIYDGHSTHVGLNIIEKAREADITILKIPAHTSDNLQPLDLAVNKSFKDKWDQALVKWQRLHVGEVMPKKDFSKLIGEIWAQVDPKVCVAGFRKAGIYPFNNKAVPEEKFHPDQLAKYKKQLCQSNEPQTQDQSTQPTPGPSWAKELSKNETETPPVSNTSIGVPSSLPSLISICLKKVNDHDKKCLSVKDKHHSDAETAETTQSNDFNAKKITIIDDRLVKCKYTFEELLLQKIKSGSPHNKEKRTKVPCGAEVITSEEVFKKQKHTEEEKMKRNKEKEERIKKNGEKIIKRHKYKN